MIDLRVFKPIQLYFKKVFSLIQTFQAAIGDILVKKLGSRIPFGDLLIEYALGNFEVLLDVDSFVADFDLFFSDEFVGIIVEFGCGKKTIY